MADEFVGAIQTTNTDHLGRYVIIKSCFKDYEMLLSGLRKQFLAQNLNTIMGFEDIEWEFNTDQSYPAGYALTDIEKSFIIKGEGGQYSNAQLEEIPEKVSKKGEKLPYRIQDLIDDLILLPYTQFQAENINSSSPSEVVSRAISRSHTDNLATEVLEENTEIDSDCDAISSDSLTESEQEELINSLDERSYNGFIQELLDIEPRATDVKNISLDHTVDQGTEFGIELGLALKTFFESQDYDDVYNEVLFGFLVAEIEADNTDYQNVEQDLDNLFDEFRTRYTLRRKISQLISDKEKKRDERAREKRNTVKKALRDCGVVPTDDIVSALSSSHLEPETIQEREVAWRLSKELASMIEEDANYIQNGTFSGVSGSELILLLFYSYCTNYGVLEEIQSRFECGDFAENMPDQHIEYPVKLGTIDNHFDIAKQNITRALRQIQGEYDYAYTGNPRCDMIEEANKTWRLTGYGRAVALTLLVSKLKYIYDYFVGFSNVQSFIKYFSIEDTLCEIHTEHFDDYENISDVRNEIRYISFSAYVTNRADKYEQLLNSI